MDKNYLILTLTLLLAIPQKGLCQISEHTNKIGPNGFGIHLPLGRALGVLEWNYQSPMGEYYMSKMRGNQNSSIGLHYFRAISDNWAIGIRMSWQHFKTGVSPTLQLEKSHLFQPQFCLSTAARENLSGYFELSGGAILTTKTLVHPELIAYSSPYDAYVWCRGSAFNLKVGLQWAAFGGNTFMTFGTQTGTFVYKVHRFELEGPVRGSILQNAEFRGIHLGLFWDITLFPREIVIDTSVLEPK